MTGGFPDEQPWKLDAACRGERAEVFFEERYEALALSFCARCPVTEACGEASERGSPSPATKEGRAPRADIDT